jgi:four helix bundle protein
MNHKELDVWKESIKLVSELYKLTNHLPDIERFGLASQIRRAAVSVPSNIAEGAARNSDKELIQFLYISLGSLSELETLTIIGNNLKYFQALELGKLDKKIQEIKKMTIGLIKYLKNKKK